MNKRLFTVELTSENDSLNALTKEDFDYIMRRGLYEYMGGFFAQNVQIKNVEQTCGTVDFAEKTIDLLKRASERLNELVQRERPSHVDFLACEIERFMQEKQ